MEQGSVALASYTWVLIKMLGALLFVCLLAVISLRYLLPKLGGLRRGARGVLQVMERYPLEHRKNLYIVRAGGDYHVIGVTEQSMTYLFPIDQQETLSALDEKNSIGEVNVNRSFHDLLQNLKGSSGSSHGQGGAGGVSS